MVFSITTEFNRWVVDNGGATRSGLVTIIVVFQPNLPLPEKVLVLLAEKFVVKLAFENLLCCASLELSGFTIGFTANYTLEGDKVV